MKKKTLIDKYSVKKAPKLYHLSYDNLNNKTLKPRVVDSGLEGEDYTSKRVCFSSSMSGCFRALQFEEVKIDYYVHILVNKDELVSNHEIVKPTTDMVPDVDYTNEYWSVGNSKLKCIGKASFYYNPEKMYYSINEPFRTPVRIKWLEKY